MNRIRTGGVTHEFQTNRKLTYEDRTSNGGLCPFIRWKILNMLKTSQRTSPDIAKQGADSPDIKRTLYG
ncbi:hypothetical protein DPMN_091792 [Dreissena polymorpha]|uniref:Uncharacterized protein n=1 Tax=Dreissena polymorpha TaxID=45954 RepID=A0A9D4L120_DREPO|nr:hypothetical protein DPMN_091792 [Dreissena polymorpha]